MPATAVLAGRMEQPAQWAEYTYKQSNKYTAPLQQPREFLPLLIMSSMLEYTLYC